MRDILQEILDNYNITHRYQRRMARRVTGPSALPFIKQSEIDRKGAKVKRELQQSLKKFKRQQAE